MNHLASASVTLALTTLALSSFAQSDYPAITSSFSESVLVGMKLSVKHGVASGTASPKRAECVSGLSADSFAPVVTRLLRESLSAGELNLAEAFFSGSVGKKYVRHGILQIYQSVGEPLPSPLPSFTDAEYKELESFAASTAGVQLIRNRILQSQEARRAYDSRIRELLASCAN